MQRYQLNARGRKQFDAIVARLNTELPEAATFDSTTVQKILDIFDGASASVWMAFDDMVGNAQLQECKAGYLVRQVRNSEFGSELFRNLRS